MAVGLTDIWDRHAFPEETPAKEQVWAEKAEHRRNETRTDIYLENSGSDMKLRRHTSDREGASNGKAAKLDDIMLLAIGSPAYQAAYDNPLSFKIGGEEIEITQGELYSRATKRAEELRRQIDEAKARGDSAEHIAILQTQLGRVTIVRDNTDPALGPMDPDRHDRVQDALRGGAKDSLLTNAITAEAAFENDPDANDTQESDMSSSMDSDTVISNETLLNQWEGADDRASFATIIEDSPSIRTSLSASNEFAAAAIGEAGAIAPSDDHAPDTPRQNTGFNLG
ncbi:MAG: hypothetical protein RIC85_04085 [Gammaproteobacteria bacterium]